ncbi:MAG: hypothetical protein AAF378_25950 [Cyanobacteria bacterium P01_A01_bin.84]
MRTKREEAEGAGGEESFSLHKQPAKFAWQTTGNPKALFFVASA